LVIEHDNRTSITEAYKGFIHEPKIDPHKAINSNIEGTRSSVEHKDESIEKEQ
jgi:3-deoxy-D-arabino-heptulosonate 7-phosphate (DAHP) synthase